MPQIKTYPSTFLQTIGIFVISAILTAVLTAPLLFHKLGGFNQETEMTIVFLVYCFVFIITTYFVNLKRKTRLAFSFGINNAAQVPLMIIILISFQIGFNVPVQKSLRSLVGNGATSIDPFDSTLLVVGALLIAPVLEEIIFRGIVLKGLLSSYGTKKAILLAAFIFAVFHGAPSQAFGALILGLFFGWIYYKTQSLGTTILLHFVTNAAGLLGSYLNFKLGHTKLSSIPDVYGDLSIYIITTSLAAFVFSVVTLLKKMKNIQIKGRELEVAA